MKVVIQKQNARKKSILLLSILYILAIMFVASFVTITFFVLKGKEITQTQSEIIHEESTVEVTTPVAQFPVGVYPSREEILENPALDIYFEDHILSKADAERSHTSWLGRTLGKLALFSWYQNLASLSSRILVIESGERKEQVADHFAKILNWDNTSKKEFLASTGSSTPKIFDGKFFPGTYTVARGATPTEVAQLITDRFTTEVLSRYGRDVESVVPLSDALIIASLLEREAYDFTDMRQISGVIWNRLFVDMKLQIDATLQYAKGGGPNGPWWPRVLPSDKYIASVYNTYKNKGLPPAPIANPSLEAILAALNPKETDCMYYFHDKKAGFHCSVTYEEHVASLKQYYGRGK